MLIIILSLIVLIYISFLVAKICKWQLNGSLTQVLNRFHWANLLVLFILLVLAEQNIWLRGFYTTKVLVCTFFLTGLVLGAIGNKTILGYLKDLYYNFWLAVPPLLTALLFIPFLGIILVAQVHTLSIANTEDIFYQDAKYRIEATPRSPLAGPIPPTLIVKKGMFEHKYAIPIPPHYHNPIKVKIEESSPKKLIIYYYPEYNEQNTPVPIPVEMTLP